MHAFELLGWLGVGATIAWTARQIIQQWNWKQARGVVVSLGPERPGESPLAPIGQVNFPVVRFTTGEGTVVCEESRDFQFGACVVGDVLEVRYDPARPSHFGSASRFRRFGPAAGLVFLGLFVVWVARN